MIILLICICIMIAFIAITNKNKQLPKKLRIYYDGNKYVLQGKRFIHWKNLFPKIRIRNYTLEIKVTHYDIDLAHKEMKNLLTWYEHTKNRTKKKVIKEYVRDNNY